MKKQLQRGFETNEFISRIDNAKKELKSNKLDALLITSEHNFRYFTGFDSHFWQSPTRPWFLIVPINNDPIAVIPSIGESALKRTWIKNINVWQSPNPTDEGVTVLAKTINNLSNQYGSIGCEIGKESVLRMPNNDFVELQNQVSQFSFIDGSTIIWDLRMIKSKAEIEKTKLICKIASDAFGLLPQIANIGESEITICNKLKIELLNRGADQIPFMGCASGQEGYEQIVFNASNKILIDKDLLFIDTGSTFDGYFCDFNRNYGFARVDDKVRKAYDILSQTVSKGIEIAKPGKKCSDIFFEMNKILEESGSISSGVGRMGHGFGLQLTEPPSNMLSDNTILKKDMTITIEPVFEFESGKMIVQEEDLLITEDGNEILTSRAPKEIPIIK